MDVQNGEPLSNGRFRNELKSPPATHRGAPFWCWNGPLNSDQLRRQLECFRQMGMGGAHIHCRTGLTTAYLGDEFMQLVRASVEHAKELGMLVWLYDEDRWPSGFGGGLVTKNKRLRARHLLITTTPYDGPVSSGGTHNSSTATAHRTNNGTLLARYEVCVRDGAMTSYRRLKNSEQAANGLAVWYAYLETATPTPWFNNQTYVDTLNPDATKKFIEVTHEAYKRTVGDQFGTTIPAIFTDEPQFAHKTRLRDATDVNDLVLPWTDDLSKTYKAAYGTDPLNSLPEIIWERHNGEASVARYRYHDHVAERFASAYADTLGQWCEENRIMLTGHMMEEPTLTSQTSALGEAMRSYRAFHLPGIDMLCDRREYTTAKQAQSASRQFGRSGVLSEIYGVTGWHFDFTGHKAQGDWQAALGVTVRVHHLAWASMAGESKRDFPAAIGWQSPWYAEYKAVEDHFARVNVALKRGAARPRVAVIHPIESFWLCFGPIAQTHRECEQREKQFEQLNHWLLFGSTDFDYIAESLLPRQVRSSADPTLRIGKMVYDVILLPGMRTIRGTTLDALETFAARGGKVIFVGEVPTLVDAELSDRPRVLAERCMRIPFEKAAILEAMQPFRDLEIRPGPAGSWMHAHAEAESILYQLREDGDTRFLFLCNTDRDRGRHDTSVAIRGQWKVDVIDTQTGDTHPAATVAADGDTELKWDAPAAGSLLLQLTPGLRTVGTSLTRYETQEAARLDAPSGGIPITLSEPNVLLLDQAEWRVDSKGDWQPRDEILRLDNLARAALGLPARHGEMPQPWADTAPAPVKGTLQLRFLIDSDIPVTRAQLALENPAATRITLNGQLVCNTDIGWWVDEAIRTIVLPSMPVGRSELILQMPVSRKRDIEACYLLGDFGVQMRGREAKLVLPPRTLFWGNWTTQCLPFYAGNVTYDLALPKRTSEMLLEVARFEGPLVTASVDGNRLGSLAFPPHQVLLPRLGDRLNLTVFGNRANAFGAVHNCDEHLQWFGPQAWRSTGDEWSYEYQLRPMGILTAPRLLSLMKG